jgi:hypothetical protein
MGVDRGRGEEADQQELPVPYFVGPRRRPSDQANRKLA